MAKQRASIPLPRLTSNRTFDASSSSAESNFDVGGAANTTRSRSLSSSSSHNSTPPTSLPEESISDVTSEKQTVMGNGVSVTEADIFGESPPRSTTARSTTARNSNGAAQSAIRRVTSSETPKPKDTRSFSGNTLVNDRQESSSDTPMQKLLRDGLKTLDMDWDVGDLGSGPAAAAPASSGRHTRRKSLLAMDKVSEVVGKVTKKVLGKRSRDDTDTDDAPRRQSRRISALSFAKDVGKGVDHEDEPMAERPSKMARVASTFSMHSLSSTLNLAKLKPRERPVKAYQRQGLYVGQNPDDYKPDGRKARSRNSSIRPTSATSDTVRKQSVMPLPMFDYLDRERHFVVPWNIFAPSWRERGGERPKDWGKINKNRFVGDAKDEWRTEKLEASLCSCKAECGADCWNRAMGAECDNTNCHVGVNCGNRDFTELSVRMARANKCDKKSLSYLFSAGVEVIKTSDRGFGVRACREFQPNEIITEYTGEIITQNEAYRRVKEEYAGKSDYYQMEFDQGMILDATRGSLARFVNHSCDPNCEMVKRTVGGQPRMALFAGDGGIMTGEELTYDYNFDPYSTTNVQKCLCGASNCRQILGPKPAGANKPSSKKEQLDMATDLKHSATGGYKRKASELFDDENVAIEIPKDLVKKRKVPQMSKGWAYVDEDMERQRQEEAEKDRELKRLQREGILGDVDVKRPKYPSRGSRMVEKIKTFASSTKPKPKPRSTADDEEETKPSKSSRLSALYTPLKRNTTTTSTSEKRKSTISTTTSTADKRKSTMSTMTTSEKRKSTLSTATLRQSILGFQPRSASGASAEEPLLRRVASVASLATTASKRAAAVAGKRSSVTSKESLPSTKRNSTVRLVDTDDE